jgi:Ca2+/Na+ antiporter
MPTSETVVGIGAARSILKVAMSHFLISGLVLRWIVTVLFGVSIAGYVYVLVAQHGRWVCTVNHLLHLVMSVAMIAMVWPIGMGVPTVGSMVFFLLAAVWFLVVVYRVSSDISDRVTNGYNAVMMTAMAWMYAVMRGNLPGQTDQHLADQTVSGSPGMEMGGMDMSAPELSWTPPEPGWITTVNWIAAVGFAVAAVYWLYRYFYFADRATDPASHTAKPANLGLLSQAFIAAGIAVMFA